MENTSSTPRSLFAISHLDKAWTSSGEWLPSRPVSVCNTSQAQTSGYILVQYPNVIPYEFKKLTPLYRATKELDKFSAVRTSTTNVKILRQFKNESQVDVGFSAEGLFGGALLGVKGAGGVGFFDWQTGQLVRRVCFLLHAHTVHYLTSYDRSKSSRATWSGARTESCCV
jgi:hypothetical protein